MEAVFEALEVALAKGQTRVALGLLRKLRAFNEVPDAFDATASCALTELDGRRQPEAIARFIASMRAAFDPDCDK